MTTNLIKFNIKTEELLLAVKELEKELPIEISEDGILIEFKRVDEKILKVNKNENGYSIETKDIAHFLLGISLLTFNLIQSPKKSEKISMNYRFKNNGVLIDCSRNGIPTIEFLKSQFRKFAQMGLNWCVLYMEDVYEIPEKPYFGTMRGKYSQTELKQLDAYASTLGIELFPGIQTLAHMNQFLMWEHEERKYQDIEDILNVGRTETLQLIDNMLKSLRESFSSNLIHLGMDEAYWLGRGTYQDEFGPVAKTEIMHLHLKNMLNLCEKYGFEPLIWDDMFFSEYSEGQEEQNKKLSRDLQLVYWDYYSENYDNYHAKLEQRKQLSDNVVFAGGAWRWLGYAPHHEKTLLSSIPALQACKDHDVSKVMVTSWGDDGSESPFATQMFGAALYAYLDCHEDYDEDEFDQWLRQFTNISLADWKKQGEFNLLPNWQDHRELIATPSKYFLYQDLLLPTFLHYVKVIGMDYGAHMKKLEAHFTKASMEGNQDINHFYATFAKTLSLKWDLPLRIRTAYEKSDLVELQRMVDNDLPQLIEDLKDLLATRRKIWLSETKSMGLEIIELRFGGMITRTESVRLRLQAYLAGEIARIEELEEPILDPIPSSDVEDQRVVHYNWANNILSRSKF